VYEHVLVVSKGKQCISVNATSEKDSSQFPNATFGGTFFEAERVERLYALRGREAMSMKPELSGKRRACVPLSMETMRCR